jgi:hypothetical protein
MKGLLTGMALGLLAGAAAMAVHDRSSQVTAPPPPPPMAAFTPPTTASAPADAYGDAVRLGESF